MSSEINTIRILGATQFLVIILGIIGPYFIDTAIGTGSISEILVNISQNEKLLRIGNLVVLIESVLIVVLGVLFYSFFKQQYNIISLVALCSFLAEAITKAAAKIGTWALIPISQEFINAGTPRARLIKNCMIYICYSSVLEPFYSITCFTSRITFLDGCQSGVLPQSVY